MIEGYRQIQQQQNNNNNNNNTYKTTQDSDQREGERESGTVSRRFDIARAGCEGLWVSDTLAARPGRSRTARPVRFRLGSVSLSLQTRQFSVVYGHCIRGFVPQPQPHPSTLVPKHQLHRCCHRCPVLIRPLLVTYSSWWWVSLHWWSVISTVRGPLPTEAAQSQS